MSIKSWNNILGLYGSQNQQDREKASRKTASRLDDIDIIQMHSEILKSNSENYMPADMFIGALYPSVQAKKNTYLLKNKEQLDNLISKYNENITKLSDKDKNYYQGFIERYKKTAETEPFARNVDAKKLFLALKKLDKYNYDTKAIPANFKRINEDTDILGKYSNDCTELKTIIENNPKYKKSMDNFYKQLYRSDAYTCLLGDDKTQVKKLAADMLKEEMSKYSDKLEDLYEETNFKSVTYTYDTDNEINNWRMHVNIAGDLEKDNCYLPKELVILHELYHVKQAVPGQSENYGDKYVELGAVIDNIVKSDEIHKKIHNIPLSETIEYSRNYTAADGRKVNTGELANKFREIMQKNHFQNWEQVFASSEGRALIESIF